MHHGCVLKGKLFDFVPRRLIWYIQLECYSWIVYIYKTTEIKAGEMYTGLIYLIC